MINSAVFGSTMMGMFHLNICTTVVNNAIAPAHPLTIMGYSLEIAERI